MAAEYVCDPSQRLINYCGVMRDSSRSRHPFSSPCSLILIRWPINIPVSSLYTCQHVLLMFVSFSIKNKTTKDLLLKDFCSQQKYHKNMVVILRKLVYSSYDDRALKMCLLLIIDPKLKSSCDNNA